jgi:hypothetical protein
MEQSKRKRRARAMDPKHPNALNAIFTSIISEIQTITNGGEEIIREGKHLIEVATDTLRQWQEKLSAAQNSYTNASKDDTISKILANIKEIKKQLSNRSQLDAPSWSQIAAAVAPPSNVSARDHKPPQNIETKRKEMKVTIREQKNKESG